jgi:hypothetical protein
LYIPDNEAGWVPPDQKWRQVRFEPSVVDWTYEREWRMVGDLALGDLTGFYVMVDDGMHAKELEAILNETPKFMGFLVMHHLTKMM